MAEVEHVSAPSSPLITVGELAAALEGPAPPTVLDVRWQFRGPSGIDDYRRGHLPGAHFVDLDRDLAGPPGRGQMPLPSGERLQAAMRRCGVSAGRGVVVYDAADSSSAGRAWWVLSYFGHPSVRVLDGGLRAWVESGRPLTDGDVSGLVGDFVAAPGHRRELDIEAAARVARDGVLLDARGRSRFLGREEPYFKPAGHIPGAVSAPTTENVSADGHFLSPADLRRRFEELGVRPGIEVGAYCGAGVAAAHELLAMAIAGFDGCLFVGSWSEWTSDPARPVAVGTEGNE